MVAISFIFGSALEKKIKSSIFSEKSKKRSDGKSKDQTSATKIKESTSSLKRLLGFCFCSKKRKSHALAIEKIKKELDVVTYIRRQFIAKIAFETIFTKPER